MSYFFVVKGLDTFYDLKCTEHVVFMINLKMPLNLIFSKNSKSI